jgi:hypothetical protein
MLIELARGICNATRMLPVGDGRPLGHVVEDALDKQAEIALRPSIIAELLRVGNAGGTAHRRNVPHTKRERADKRWPILGAIACCAKAARRGSGRS